MERRSGLSLLSVFAKDKQIAHDLFSFGPLAFLSIVMPQGMNGQTTDDTSVGFGRAIEDNSFLIEEAYNQEKGVVQHISNTILSTTPRTDLMYSLTQEWPLGGERHQLSYTIPYCLLSSSHQGQLGDVLLNYRYQLFDRGDWAAVAPRLSIMIPTGKVASGLGSGVVGVQVMLPASKRLSESFVVHANAGFTFLPTVQQKFASGGEITHDLTTYNLGGSIIWLAGENFNLLLEYLVSFSTDVHSNGAIVQEAQSLISPGFRYAINIGSLQIVPGVGIPLNPAARNVLFEAFLYLSFEHPF